MADSRTARPQADNDVLVELVDTLTDFIKDGSAEFFRPASRRRALCRLRSAIEDMEHAVESDDRVRKLKAAGP